VLQRLKVNIKERITQIDCKLLIAVMERHTFAYFHGAFNYYRSALKIIRVFNPDLAIFSADGCEDFILAAQAAKQAGINTAIIPHGLYSWGYSEYKSGRFKVFDYGMAFGQVDVDNYIRSGMPAEKINVTSFPYFERFLPFKKTSTCNYRKALVLAPDGVNVCPSEKIAEVLKYYRGVIQLLDELGIELIGIKGRLNILFSNSGLNTDYIILDGRKVPLLTGYTAFPEAVKDVELVIGMPGTALIEATLLGKDYYVYQHTPFHDFTPSILPALYGYVNVSYNMIQLRENILNKKQTYKQGFSVCDLVDLEGVQNREDLYRKFESEIMSVMESVFG